MNYRGWQHTVLQNEGFKILSAVAAAGNALGLQSGSALFHKPEETILTSWISTREDHFIHIPAVPSMSKQQTHFKNKNGLHGKPTVSSNNLQAGIFLLNIFYHIDLEDGVPLRGILQQKENKFQPEFLQQITNTGPEELQIFALASWGLCCRAQVGRMTPS